MGRGQTSTKWKDVYTDTPTGEAGDPRALQRVYQTQRGRSILVGMYILIHRGLPVGKRAVNNLSGECGRRAGAELTMKSNNHTPHLIASAWHETQVREETSGSSVSGLGIATSYS